MPQEKKKIVMYFKRKRTGELGDPFAKFGVKRKVYHYFFQKGQKLGFEMFLANGEQTYLGELDFENLSYFKKENITADAVYDRSGGLSFPTNNINKKVLNCIAFKTLCNDKNSMYGLLKKYMPKSFEITSQKSFIKMLEKFDNSSLIVLKPAKGLGGKGIIIANKDTIKNTKLEKKESYVLQEFVDTSNGIKGITNKKHDLRVIVIGGKIIYANLRTPKKGSLLANVSQGGKIKEIPIEKIPKKVKLIVKKIQNKIDKKYNYPIYSIDFGISNSKPYVFEINDQIGFPRDSTKNYKKFIDSILRSIERLSKK